MIIPYLIQWAKERLVNSPHLKNWYLQPFNISNHLISGMLARILHLDYPPAGQTAESPGEYGGIAIDSGDLCFHQPPVTGIAIMLARKVTFRDSGIFTSSQSTFRFYPRVLRDRSRFSLVHQWMVHHPDSFAVWS